MFWENSIKTCILSRVKQITSPSWMHMRQVLRAGALGRPRGIEWRGRWEGGPGWRIHVNPWLIHVNVWQKPLQYCKVISLQLIKINGGGIELLITADNIRINSKYTYKKKKKANHSISQYSKAMLWPVILKKLKFYERFYEELQGLLELTSKTYVLFIIGDWNAKVGSQETPGVTGKFGLGVQNEAGQRLIELCQEKALVIANILIQEHKTLHMDITRWSIPKSDWLCSLQPKIEKLYTVSKNKNGIWLWLRSWTPYCQIQT